MVAAPGPTRVACAARTLNLSYAASSAWQPATTICASDEIQYLFTFRFCKWIRSLPLAPPLVSERLLVLDKP